ncbi:MAG: AAA family ATPase [Pseudomonadota bacterium]
MSLTHISLKRFTAFESLELPLSEGLNVFIGANGTGKTHLMKVAYSACDVSKTRKGFAEKLVRVFLPSRDAIGRLVKRRGQSSHGQVAVYRGARKLSVQFSNHAKRADSTRVVGMAKWTGEPVESVYIPVKEMLSNAPGFRALYSQREIHYEEVYADLLDRAYLPIKTGPRDKARQRLLEILREVMAGKVEVKDEEFFLRSPKGNLEFSLLAEGMRKLALLWILIQNGTLTSGSVLFWDEPETNLNPRLFGVLMDILLELQRNGVQVFLATHDYVVLKELELRREKSDNVAFHSLYADDESGGDIVCHTSDSYGAIHPNAIAEAFGDIYDRDVRRSLGGKL